MRLPSRVGSGLPPYPGFPFRGSIAVSRASTSLASSGNSGIARASQVLDASLHAYHALCGPRQTLRDLTARGPFVLASGPLTPSPSALFRYNEAVSSFRKCGLPCGLRDSLCTLQLFRSASTSSTVATLGMSGWLGLTQPGLPPGQKRQASLGAQTIFS